jgi:hypothetical protein
MPTTVKLDADTGFPWPVIDLDRGLLLAALDRCERAGVKYRLGAKAPSLNAVPGRDFTHIDCSGFLRWIVWQAGQVALTDGSVQQHYQIRALGFKPSTRDAGRLHDGAVRIAFLPPLKSFGFVGHVALIYRARTLDLPGADAGELRG